MRVARWGRSLGVRLPKRLVTELGISEGDEITMLVAGDGRFEFIKRERPAEAPVKKSRCDDKSGRDKAKDEGWAAVADGIDGCADRMISIYDRYQVDAWPRQRRFSCTG